MHVTILLPVEKEKRPVLSVIDFWNPHRTTHGKAHVMQGTLCALMMAGPVGRERDSGGQRFVDYVIVGAAVELVGSAARGEIEEASRGQSELGCEVGGLKRELLDGFH